MNTSSVFFPSVVTLAHTIIVGGFFFRLKAVLFSTGMSFLFLATTRSFWLLWMVWMVDGLVRPPYWRGHVLAKASENLVPTIKSFLYCGCEQQLTATFFINECPRSFRTSFHMVDLPTDSFANCLIDLSGLRHNFSLILFVLAAVPTGHWCACIFLVFPVALKFSMVLKTIAWLTVTLNIFAIAVALWPA